MRCLSAVLAGLLLSVAAAADEAEPYAGEVTASALNLRAGPGEAYQAVAKLEKGDRLVVLGRHANNSSWFQVEIPQGYEAWVSAELIKKAGDGTGEVTANRVLVRPRPSTRYHQLSGRLNKGETVKIVGEETSASEGLWYRIQVPARIPLYAHAEFIRKIGPASMARKAEADHAPAPLTVNTAEDKSFQKLEPEVRVKLTAAKTTTEIEPLRRAVAEIDANQLSLDNRERRVRLLTDLLDRERSISIAEIKAKEDEINEGLDARLADIERAYKKRLAEIKDEYESVRKPRYVATGIVKYSPDLLGRYPSYRLEEAGKMRYYLIATHFDLARFVNKRVGVMGITDPESGTGYETVMIKRIEVLGDR